jgi:anti-anti-sigma factor
MPIQRWSDRIWVVKLHEEPALSEDLHAALNQAKQNDPVPHLVVDLTGVRMINSSNLAQMLRLRKLAVDKDTQLRIAGPSDTVWAAMLTTGLDKVFEFAQDVSSALAAVQMNDNGSRS